MIKLLTKLFNKHKQFVFYAAIGVSGLLLDIIFFAILFNLVEIDKQIANFISTSIGITNNFILNSKFNFKVNDKMLRRFVSFYAIGFLGLGLTAIFFFVLTDRMGVNANITKVISLPFVLVFQFVLNKLISFKNVK